MEFMKKSISQLRSRLRIKDNIEAYCHDYEDFGPDDPGWTEYWFNIPNYDATVQLFTRFNGRYTIRHAIFDIARALDQNEALEKEHRIASALDAINSTFGDGAIKLAGQGSGRIHSGTFKCAKQASSRMPVYLFYFLSSAAIPIIG